VVDPFFPLKLIFKFSVTKFPPKFFPGPLQFESAPDLCDFDSIDQSDLSLESFWTKYLFTQKPVIIKNGITHWPAFEKWRDVNYLTNLAGFRTVPIELGSKYDSENWSQGLFKFEEFLRLYFVEPNKDREVAYLAQHDLFEQIPRLKNDIKIPEYCAISESDPVIKAWIGPKNTISSMHTDPKQNLLCQVFGEKLLILAAPENSKNLYPHDGILNNTSQIDPTNLNFKEFPLSKNVKFLKVHLKAGDILFIPKLWWHYVQSLTPSASVSFWFQSES
jgi:lysine-specific demethylase 8